MLVASLVDGMMIDFGCIIIDNLFIRTYKVANSLPISCLIKKLCRQANVPSIRGIDNEV